MTAPLFYRLAEFQARVLGEPLTDPLLDPADADALNPLDAVDPAWGLPASDPAFPARVVERAARTVCGHCDDTGLVVTDEDGVTGYRPCHRCPSDRGAA
ncbi:hypothetical protein [Nocardioides sp. PD653-B2]|nr:hypothetical protein [Nocardioides sp. PD653-B2]GAW50578.1 uncharacterized protein PD653B2_2914 [Nocardioides sp. PD653-B2]